MDIPCDCEVHCILCKSPQMPLLYANYSKFHKICYTCKEKYPLNSEVKCDFCENQIRVFKKIIPEINQQAKPIPTGYQSVIPNEPAKKAIVNPYSTVVPDMPNERFTLQPCSNCKNKSILDNKKCIHPRCKNCITSNLCNLCEKCYICANFNCSSLPCGVKICAKCSLENKHEGCQNCPSCNYCLKSVVSVKGFQCNHLLCKDCCVSYTESSCPICDCSNLVKTNNFYSCKNCEYCFNYCQTCRKYYLMEKPMCFSCKKPIEMLNKSCEKHMLCENCYKGSQGTNCQLCQPVQRNNICNLCNTSDRNIMELSCQHKFCPKCKAYALKGECVICKESCQVCKKLNKLKPMRDCKHKVCFDCEKGSGCPICKEQKQKSGPIKVSCVLCKKLTDGISECVHKHCQDCYSNVYVKYKKCLICKGMIDIYKCKMCGNFDKIFLSNQNSDKICPKCLPTIPSKVVSNNASKRATSLFNRKK
ncbi:hypothetical protein SteCoe_35491 [Stentor coeruleus]|uniref:RING-type domain-containing protein n=1 Tax=Stentor coeruleus TaxID=5963 RepID=A0A1R2ASI2_9CILI|nr:hypothetical protein SteCoe_35491 [Stentor coeruleus]